MKEFNAPMPTDVSVITTYRCMMRCKMCGIWENPSDPKNEIKASELEILPKLKFANVTGGEPFLRNDLEEIVEVLYKKAPRVVISTSGYRTEQVVKLAERFPNIGIRVSIEGMEQTNNFLRGMENSYERGLLTLKLLHEMGIKDIGFGQTLSNHNSKDLIPLYEICKAMNYEFATAAFHNGYYFHKFDNQISDKDELCKNIGELINRLLKENKPKSWFRAYFNHGLINYIKGNKRLLPCEAGTVNFFIDPYGEVYPCNALEDKYWKKSMGNIRNGKSFEDIWNSAEAGDVRKCVGNCPKNCWMMGTVAPVMKKYIWKVLPWVMWNKARRVFG
jgi:radical SAM protein with 4Fe4S-binding SPASM domain